MKYCDTIIRKRFYEIFFSILPKLNGGKTDGETKKANRKCFYQQKCFSSEPNTFASVADLLLKNTKETSGETQKKKLTENFKYFFGFSHFARALLHRFSTSKQWI